MKKIFIILAVIMLSGITNSANAQTKTVTGLVVLDNEPCAGAVVSIKWTNIGAGMTDTDGKFSIQAKPSDILVFSYLGCKSKEIGAGGQTDVKVELAYAAGIEETPEETGNNYESNSIYDSGMRFYTVKDYADAAKRFLKSAELGNARAQNQLGVMYSNGIGVKKDYAEAVKWLIKAAKQEYAVAQNNLGYIYYNDDDYVEAAKWYRKAADQGNADAQHNLGIMYDIGYGVDGDVAEAEKWYRKAADQGNADAQNSLGIMYGNRDNYSEAIKWFTKAAEQGDADAQCNLGSMYELGYGVKKDKDEAVKWYKKAAAQKYQKAADLLKKLNIYDY